MYSGVSSAVSGETVDARLSGSASSGSVGEDTGSRVSICGLSPLSKAVFSRGIPEVSVAVGSGRTGGVG